MVIVHPDYVYAVIDAGESDLCHKLLLLMISCVLVAAGVLAYSNRVLFLQIVTRRTRRDDNSERWSPTDTGS